MGKIFTLASACDYFRAGGIYVVIKEEWELQLAKSKAVEARVERALANLQGIVSDCEYKGIDSVSLEDLKKVIKILER